MDSIEIWTNGSFVQCTHTPLPISGLEVNATDLEIFRNFIIKQALLFNTNSICLHGEIIED